MERVGQEPIMGFSEQEEPKELMTANEADIEYWAIHDDGVAEALRNLINDPDRGSWNIGGVHDFRGSESIQVGTHHVFYEISGDEIKFLAVCTEEEKDKIMNQSAALKNNIKAEKPPLYN